MYGDDAGLLNVYLTTNSSTPRVSVRNISGNHGNYWRYMEIDLNVESVFKVSITIRKNWNNTLPENRLALVRRK